VAAGLLFAPKSGPETRDLLRSKADEGKDYLKKRTTEVRDQAADVLERGKSTVTRQRDNLVAAVEAGKQAYREAVSTMPSDGETI
jgi:gas vesicle protein